MSEHSNITREDLVAVAYAVYSSLYEKGSKPLTPQEFGLTCEKYFKDFSEISDK